MPEFGGGSLTVPAEVLQCVYRHVDADLVAELEAVRDRSRGARHPDLNALDNVVVDSAGEHEAGHANEPNWREVHSRPSGSPIDRNPDLAGVLRAEPMECQGRQKTEDPLRDPFRNLRESVMFGRLKRRERIQSATDTIELTLCSKATHVLRMDASGGLRGTWSNPAAGSPAKPPSPSVYSVAPEATWARIRAWWSL